MKSAGWTLGLACIGSLAACSTAAAPATRAPEIAPPTSIAPAPVAPVAVVLGDPCERAHARAVMALDPVMGQLADHVVRGEHDDAIPAWTSIVFSLLRCIPAGRGAWIALPTSASIAYVHAPVIGGSSDPIDTYALRATAVIAWVSPEGAWSMGGETFHVNDLPTDAERSRLTIDRVLDFDGDGVAEALVTYDDEGYESHGVRHRLLSVAGGIVRVYPPAADIDIAEVVDPDADGRPDLVSIGRYWHVTPCGSDGPPVGGPPVLFHALPDGTFSASDAVAAQYLRERCPAPPTTLLVPDDCGGVETTHRIACARLWGVSREEVQSRLDAEQAALSPRAARALESLVDWDALSSHAAIEPPLRFTPEG